MDVCKPRVRRRGFFLHSTDGNEPETTTGEHENAEGVTVRFRVNRSSSPRQFTGGRQTRPSTNLDEGRPEIRSGSATGSRQRAHLPR
jgi:hypothetical protein